MQSSDPSVLGSKYSRRVSAHRRYLCAKLLEADGSVDLRAIRQGSRTFGHASPGARHSALDRIAPHGGAPTSRFPQGEPYYPVRGRGQVWDSALRRPETGTHFQSRAAHAVASTTNRQQVPSRSLPWRGRWQAFRLCSVGRRPMTWQRISAADAARAHPPPSGASFHVWARLAAVAAARQFAVFFASPRPQPG